jgi:hypothetical protein
MVRDGEKLSSVLDSAPQKSISLVKIFKKFFKNSKNAGLCNLLSSRILVTTLQSWEIARARGVQMRAHMR